MLLAATVVLADAQEKLYSDEFPLGDVALLDGLLKAARDLNIRTLLQYDCEAVVKGQGSLLAFASADLKDTEPYTTPRVKTWKGRALLVVRSGKKKGKTLVGIKSQLPVASTVIVQK